MAEVKRGGGALYLGIESSCDETAVGLVSETGSLEAEAVASSARQQNLYGGIVPEVAAREHVAALPGLVAAVLDAAAAAPSDIAAIGVTSGPGLFGSLLVGMTAAKALAVAWRRPLIGVHHLEAHLYANALRGPIVFPSLALLVSGGHTGLWVWRGHGNLVRIGETRDDAAGEAIDKGARLLGLGYPGGPEIERLAATADRPGPRLPIGRIRGGSPFDMSFSGLKTALRQEVEQNGAAHPERLAASLQEAVVAAIMERVELALDSYPVRALYAAGGVAANRALRARLDASAARRGIAAFVPEARYCTDNGVMVALAARYRFGTVAPLTLDAGPITPWPLGDPAGASEEGDAPDAASLRRV
ncbi:MAG: tRNA (adenosine(37)-N6)-threonylcarbamoyltransferase complex transferase subunit TsaD [Clostridia bacterium]